MGKKLALNLLYNVGIIFCIATVYWGFQHKQYAYIIGPIFIGALLIIFKLRLLKEVRNMQKKQ